MENYDQPDFTGQDIPGNIPVQPDGTADVNSQQPQEDAPTIDTTDVVVDAEATSSDGAAVESGEQSSKGKDEETEDILQEYLPWILLAVLGFVLMLVAVVLLGSGFRPNVMVIEVPTTVAVPAYKATVKVKSVHGKKVRYVDPLKNMGSLAARSLRYKVEPKFMAIYRAADMEVKNVLTVSFKFSNSGSPNSTVTSRHLIRARSGDVGDKKAIKTTHWIYLKENFTETSLDDLKTKILASVDGIEGIEIVKATFELHKIENMTSEQAFQLLSDAGFFINGLDGLDMAMLETLGIDKPLGFGLQAEGDEGPCPGIQAPNYGKITPETCKSSLNTFVQMSCEFSCPDGFDAVGDLTRVCLSSGKWSGEPAQCLPRCPPMKMLYKGVIKPDYCTRTTSSVGQMCFLECPSTSHRLYFPEEEYSRVGYAGKSWSIEGKMQPFFYDMVMENDTENVLGKGHFEAEDLELSSGPWSHYWDENIFKARGFFRECLPSGQWSGAQASCKAFCPKLVIPQHSTVTPEYCTIDAVEGESCSASCDAGYVFVTGSDLTTVTCDIGGKWNKVFPPCKKSCSPLGTTPNLHIVTKTCEFSPHAGMVCETECDEGYALIGKNFNECDDEGNWLYSLPTCVQACSPHSSITNGMLLSDSGLCNTNELIPSGTTCDVMCDYGFTANVNTTTCTGGAWTHEDIKCTRSCNPLEADPNGSWAPLSCHTSHQTSDSDPCELTCDPGYNVIGSNAVSCEADGIWSASQPTCEVTCETALVVPTNGGFVNETVCDSGNAPENFTCSFYCDNGYKLTGGRVLSCFDGSWSDSEPTCVAEDQYGIVQHLQDRGRTICLALTANGELVKMETTEADCESERGLWVPEAGNLLKNVFSGECLSLGNSTTVKTAPCNSADPYQEFTASFEFHIVAGLAGMMFSSGYHTALQPQITDPYDERDSETLDWIFYKHDDLTAKSAPLSLKGVLDNGDCLPIAFANSVDITPACTSGSQSAGTVCSLSCPGGSSLSDSAPTSVTCTGGVWGITADIHCVPTADQSTCSSITNVGANGLLITPATCNSTSMAIRTECTFECPDEGTYLAGPDSITCEINGRWSSQAPSMCRTFCPTLTPLPDHSHLIVADGSSCTGKSGVGAEGGTVCPLVCQPGYYLTGTETMTCMDDGLWNDDLPVCKKLCPDIEVFISHSSLLNCDQKQVEDGSYLENTTCSFVCDVGYLPNLKGDTVTCNENGRWFHHSGALQCRAECPKITAHPHMILEPTSCLSSGMRAGTGCFFSCYDGYGIDMPKGAEMRAFYSAQKGTIRICGIDNMWQDPFVTCTKKCPPLPKIAYENSGYYSPDPCNGQSSHSPGTECKLMCQGHDAVYEGASSVTCGDDGKWSETLGSCAPACQAIIPGRHALVTPSTCMSGYVKSGSACQIICPKGMDHSGPELTVCTDVTNWRTGSRWSDGGESASCLPRCQPIQARSNMMVFPESCQYSTKKEGDVCEFTCDGGYNLYGSASLQCTVTGSWSKPVPECEQACNVPDVANARVFCDGTLVSSENLGQIYHEGHVCYFLCDMGYMADDENEITCKGGLWSPNPYCAQAPEAFPIMQKIGDNMKCLVAEHVVKRGPADIVGSDWKLSALKSKDACILAGNNIMWTWYRDHGLKHAQTGLCLEASATQPEAEIVLRRCQATKLQSWACDASFPYRFTISSTDLSIDTSYEGLGPVIASWTHANTYWITHNANLETTATICSNKESSTCPPLSARTFKVGPTSCLFNNIPMWKECKVGCAKDTTYSGQNGDANNEHMVECQPTGEWEGLSDITCHKHCPRLTPVFGGVYVDEQCVTEATSPHGTSCEMSCSDGMKLTNGEDMAGYYCDDGKWHGDMKAHCQVDCSDNIPEGPPNGQISCNPKTCEIRCDPGYSPSGNSTLMTCSPSGYYEDSGNVTCQPTYQFQIQAENTVFANFNKTCLSTVLINNMVRVMKMQCNELNEWSFWQWEIGGNYSMIKNVHTGFCLAAIKMESFAPIKPAVCDKEDDLQQWACHNVHHPGILGLVTISNSSLDIGSIQPDQPPVMVMDESSLGTGKWKAADHSNAQVEICAHRASGACPILRLGPYESSTEDCVTGVGVPVNTECEITCTTGHISTAGETQSVTCQSDGSWSAVVHSCIVVSNQDPTCDAFTLGVGVEVSPSVCGHANEDHKMKKGSKCIFSCAPGYFLVGDEISYCNGDSAWSKPVPECKPFCPGKPTNVGVAVDPPICESVQVPAGTVCNHTCGEGFVRWSNQPTSQLLECLDDGTWDGTDLLCEVGCPALKHLGASENEENVTAGLRRSMTTPSCFNNWGHLGTECEFSCPAEQVTVDGSEVMKCGPNGQWTGRVPRCMEAFHCPEVQNITGIKDILYIPKLNRKAVVAGTAVKIECEDDYHPDGDRYRICKSDRSWEGKGPAVPTCVRKCPTLIPMFAAKLSPVSCGTKDSVDSTVCTFICKAGTHMTQSAIPAQVVCDNGNWTIMSLLPRCVPNTESTLSRLQVADTRDTPFMLTTRYPEIGCFYADTGVMGADLKWRPASHCDISRPENQFVWKNTHQLMSKAGGRCLQPVLKIDNSYGLGVGVCDNVTSQSFICGDPLSSNAKFNIYAKNRWWSILALRSKSGTITNLKMIKGNYSTGVGVEIRSNVEPLSHERYDGTVCSRMCGGRFTHSTNTEQYIVSPGFLKTENYPPNSDCVWTIVANDKIIRFEMLELELETDTAVKCTTDCLQVYEGDTADASTSELLAVYSGHGIANAKPRIVSTARGVLQIKFTSNHENEYSGFAAKYYVEDWQNKEESCGFRYTSLIPMDNTEEEVEALSQRPQGFATSSFRWPFMVSLREWFPGTSKAVHRCSGVMIANDIVLSAAHCAKFASYGDGSQIVMGIGRNLQSEMDKEITSYQTLNPRFMIYDGYDHVTRIGDLAIWRLMNPLPVGPGMGDACRPDQGFRIHSPATECYAVGWSALASGVKLNQLTMSRVHIVPTSQCEEELGLTPGSGFICVEGKMLNENGNNEIFDSEPLYCEWNKLVYVIGLRAYTHVGSRVTYRLYTDLQLMDEWITKAQYEIHAHYRPQNAHLLYGAPKPSDAEAAIDPAVFVQDSKEVMDWLLFANRQ